MALNPQDFIPDTYNIREAIRHIATGINKGEARNKEVAHFRKTLKESRDNTGTLSEKIKAQTWYHVESYASGILEKASGDAGKLQKEIDWVLWATMEINKDYYFGDLYMVEGQLVKVYEAIKGTLNRIVEVSGTAPEKKFHETLLKTGFSQEFVDLYLFTTDWRNDIVHYHSVARATTVSSSESIKHIFSDAEVKLDIRVNSNHFGIINLCNLLYDRLKDFLKIPTKEFSDYHEKMQKKLYPNSPAR